MEVIRDILLSIGSGVSKPTLIMYDTRLSWIGLKRYLPILEEKELVECRVDT
jgi:predicted transcriptional regulator